MEYTVQKLAQLAGISARTLRHYDAIGLLPPARVSSNGYRIYGQREVDLLQQILFYRELGLELQTIGDIIKSPSFDGKQALGQHLAALVAKREQLDLLIANVKKTMQSAKGEITMQDEEKFEGFKQKRLEENETKYGKEIREKYGEAAVEKSNSQWQHMTQEQYTEMESLGQAILEKLGAARQGGDPKSAAAQEVCALHKRWITLCWGQYSPEGHMGLAEMYVEDPRFAAYYDKVGAGSAIFLRDAMRVFLGV